MRYVRWPRISDGMALTYFSRWNNVGDVFNRSGGLVAGAPRVSLYMADPVFMQAYETVRRSYSDEAWNALTPRQITDAIYQEIRRIDAEIAASGGRGRAALSKDPH